MKVERTDKPYTRKNVREDKESMYIFTDNTDRDSGKSLIPNTSWYNSQRKGINGRWTDDDLEEFKKVIDDDFDKIYNDCKNFKRIVFPMGGIFNSKISAINKVRTPKLYEYLKSKCMPLLTI